MRKSCLAKQQRHSLLVVVELIALVCLSAAQNDNQTIDLFSEAAGNDTLTNLTTSSNATSDSEDHYHPVYRTYILTGNQNLYEKLFNSSSETQELSVIPYCYVRPINGSDDGSTKFSNLSIDEYNEIMEKSKRSPITLTLWIQLLQMVELNERSQTITMIVSIQKMWEDCRLRWSVGEFGVQSLYLAPNTYRQLDLFEPGVRLLEALDPKEGDSSETQVTVGFNGNMSVTEEYKTVFSCDIEVNMYPFDIQICYLTFESVLSEDIVNMEYTRFSVLEESDYFLNRYIRSEQWSLTIFPPEVSRRTMCFGNEVSPTCTNDGLKFKIILRRNPNYQLINLFFPAFLIVVISSCVFLVPPGGGDKMGLSVSILLSLYMFSQLMYDKMPETGSVVPLLSQYFLVCIILVTASCLYASLSAVFASACPRLPSVLQNFVTLFAPVLMFDMIRSSSSSSPRRVRIDTSLDRNSDVDSAKESAEDNEEFGDFHGFIVHSPEQVTWAALGALLDRAFFVAHLAASVSIMAAYLVHGYGPWTGFSSLNLTNEEIQYVCVQSSLQNTTVTDISCLSSFFTFNST